MKKLCSLLLLAASIQTIEAITKKSRQNEINQIDMYYSFYMFDGSNWYRVFAPEDLKSKLSQLTDSEFTEFKNLNTKCQNLPYGAYGSRDLFKFATYALSKGLAEKETMHRSPFNR